MNLTQRIRQIEKHFNKRSEEYTMLAGTLIWGAIGTATTYYLAKHNLDGFAKYATTTGGGLVGAFVGLGIAIESLEPYEPNNEDTPSWDTGA
ncbi:MAG TPA: hypothetical protein VKE88_03500 [Candidatus Nanoarchaeia archaeon]|nr:hypothetical protein [Candidatus Nanoarchaeia archaeon]